MRLSNGGSHLLAFLIRRNRKDVNASICWPIHSTNFNCHDRYVPILWQMDKSQRRHNKNLMWWYWRHAVRLGNILYWSSPHPGSIRRHTFYAVAIINECSSIFLRLWHSQVLTWNTYYLSGQVGFHFGHQEDSGHSYPRCGRDTQQEAFCGIDIYFYHLHGHWICRNLCCTSDVCLFQVDIEVMNERVRFFQFNLYLYFYTKCPRKYLCLLFIGLPSGRQCKGILSQGFSWE